MLLPPIVMKVKAGMQKKGVSMLCSLSARVMGIQGREIKSLHLDSETQGSYPSLHVTGAQRHCGKREKTLMLGIVLHGLTDLHVSRALALHVTLTPSFILSYQESGPGILTLIS